jgi:Domain of unknown function (DUF4349)
MSQRDLVAELRAARTEAPPQVRARVQLIVAADTTPREHRTLTWRRALVIALPVAAAVAATIVFTRPSHEPQVVPVERAAVDHGSSAGGATVQKSLATPALTLTAPAPSPAPSTTRVQRYGAYLALRVATPNGVSTGVKQALRITKSLGGYAGSVNASTSRKSGSADLTLKIPRSHVQEAIARLSAIGMITDEQVDVQDLQAGVNATGRTIARLQRSLAALRTEPQSDSNTARIAALVRRIAGLQRADAATIRAARYATISLHLGTAAPVPGKPHHGPLHGLVVAFRWLGVGAVYALALGAPFVLVVWLAWIAARTLRRRREDALLSQS